MNTLQEILTIIQEAATVAQPLLVGVPVGEAADVAAQSLIKIVQAALTAHQQITGQPIDLTQLQPIAPVE